MISGVSKMVNVASCCAPHGPLVSPYLTLNASVVKPEEHVIPYFLTCASTSSDIPGGRFAHLQKMSPSVA